MICVCVREPLFLANQLHGSRNTTSVPAAVGKSALLSICCPADLNGRTNYGLFFFFYQFVLIIAVECTFVVYFFFLMGSCIHQQVPHQHQGSSRDGNGNTHKVLILLPNLPFTLFPLTCTAAAFLVPFLVRHCVTLALTRLQIKRLQLSDLHTSISHFRNILRISVQCQMYSVAPVFT